MSSLELLRSDGETCVLKPLLDAIKKDRKKTKEKTALKIDQDRHNIFCFCSMHYG